MNKMSRTLSISSLFKWSLAASLLTSCATGEKTEKEDLELDDTPTPITMEATAEGITQPPVPLKKGGARKSATLVTKLAKASENEAAKIAGCISIYNRITPAYKKLALKRALPLKAAGSKSDQDSALSDLLNSTEESCRAPAARAHVLKLLSGVVSQHSSRIGVILPLTGPKAQQSRFILSGMRSAFVEAGLKFDAQVIVKDSSGNAAATEQALAELIFKDQVSIVMGGLEDAEAKVMLPYADALMLPTLLLTRDRDLGLASKYAFRVYPDQKNLADTLALAAMRDSHPRVVILKPSTHKSDKISEYFAAALRSAGGTITAKLEYAPNDFESMQAIGRQLFKINTVERADEYRRAYQKARQDAQVAGQPFDARMIVLKPIVDFDAVFIPDDFRTVRHFAKLFRFYGLKHLPLIGNHEWRSTGLIQPYDDFLDGSIFADFIGSYAKLPASISAPTSGSPFFVDPEQVAKVDFQLIGYRIAKLGTLATKDPNARRRHIATTMMLSQSDGRDQFAPGPYFESDHNSKWPTYLFRVKAGELSILPKGL